MNTETSFKKSPHHHSPIHYRHGVQTNQDLRGRLLLSVPEFSSRVRLWINEFVYQYGLLILVTLLAAVLRFYKLGEWSFWGDELFSVSGREDGFNYTLVRQSLSLALIQEVVSIHGISEWSARLVPALVGILSVPLLYWPVKKMFGPAVGLLSGLLLALSPWHLYWSQNARFYTALLLFYSLALLIFYLGLEADRPRYLLVSLLLLGLAAKERLLALFFVPVIFTYLVLLQLLPWPKPKGLRWRYLAIFIIPGFLLGLFFARPYLLNLPDWMEGFGFVNNNPFWLLAGFVFYVGLPAVCMAAVGMVYGLQQKNRAVLLLTLSATLPLLGIMAIAPFHYTANRYIFVSLSSWLILASFAAVRLFTHAPNGVRLLALGSLFFLIMQPVGEDVLYYRYQNGNRDNWRAAFEYVHAHKEEGDLVFSINRELGNYYLQEQTLSLNQLDPVEIQQNGTRAWIVEDMVAQESLPGVHRWLQDQARLVAVLDVVVQARNFQMRVYLYDPAWPANSS